MLRLYLDWFRLGLSTFVGIALYQKQASILRTSVGVDCKRLKRRRKGRRKEVGSSVSFLRFIRHRQSQQSAKPMCRQPQVLSVLCLRFLPPPLIPKWEEDADSVPTHRGN